jgi:hypothetical protein
MAAELIYWDSATFLAYFQQEEGRVDLCRGTLERAEMGEVCIITSALTIAECLWLGEVQDTCRKRSQGHCRGKSILTTACRYGPGTS